MEKVPAAARPKPFFLEMKKESFSVSLRSVGAFEAAGMLSPLVSYLRGKAARNSLRHRIVSPEGYWLSRADVIVWPYLWSASTKTSEPARTDAVGPLASTLATTFSTSGKISCPLSGAVCKSVSLLEVQLQECGRTAMARKNAMTFSWCFSSRVFILRM